MKKNLLYTFLLGLTIVFTTSVSQAQVPAKNINKTKTEVDSTNVSAISIVNGENLESYTDFNLSNNLQGRLSGLVVRSTTNGLGNNASALYVHGLSSNSNNTAMVIVDGMERSMNDLIPEEVENIQVLKDASAEILYGPRAANGVILVTTKRGHMGERNVWASLEAGLMSMTRTPEYLNSYDYATLYNQARVNDGLTPFYSNEELDGYKNSTGYNDLRYPNVDYYNQFLNKTAPFQKAIVGIDGGSNKTKYSFIANYLRATGFEAIGDQPNLQRFNARGNLDIKINDLISVKVDASARLELRKFSRLNCSQVMSSVNSIRPNEYPLTISADDLGLDETDDGVPYFGTSLSNKSNLYANMEYGGFSQERYITSSNNIGIYFNLDEYVEGLKLNSIVSLDNYDYMSQGQTNNYATYAIQNRLDPVLEFTKCKKTSLQSNQSVGTTTTYKTLGWQSNLDYNHIVNDLHALKTSLGFNYYFLEVKGISQDRRTLNVTYNVNYNYDKKYTFDGTAALMGSNRYEDLFLSYSLGASWIISKENFMKGNNVFNYLKLKASAGRLGYESSTGYLLYNTAFSKGGNIVLGEQNKSNAHTTNLTRIGSDNIDWEYSKQFNIGTEGRLLKNRLGFELNYFYEKRSNIIGALDSQYSAVVGTFAYQGNMGSIRNQGFDLNLNWKDHIGELSYSATLNATYSKNKVLDWDEVSESNPALNYVGRSTDAMIGYKSLGLFGRDIDKDGAQQYLGYYQEGDIAYADLNNDGVVDQYDVKELGNSFPRWSGGISLQLDYKNWGLFMLGTAEFNVDTWTKNSYFWNYGDNKYSVLALDAYNPITNPNGKFPRLTTTNGENNFRSSDFWLEDVSFFRLKNIELTYDFKKPCKNIEKIQVYARATNVFVIANEKDLDPELINSGISNYPVTRNISLGAKITF